MRSTRWSGRLVRSGLALVIGSTLVVATGPAAGAASGLGLRDTQAGYALSSTGEIRTEMTVKVHEATCESFQEALAVLVRSSHLSPTGLPNVSVTVGSGCEDGETGLEPSYLVSVSGMPGGGPLDQPVSPGDKIKVVIDVKSPLTTVVITNTTAGWTYEDMGDTGPSAQYAVTGLVTWAGVTDLIKIKNNRVDGEPIGRHPVKRVLPDDSCADLSELRRKRTFTIAITCG